MPACLPGLRAVAGMVKGSPAHALGGAVRPRGHDDLALRHDQGTPAAPATHLQAMGRPFSIRAGGRFPSGFNLVPAQGGVLPQSGQGRALRAGGVATAGGDIAQVGGRTGPCCWGSGIAGVWDLANTTDTRL